MRKNEHTCKVHVYLNGICFHVDTNDLHVHVLAQRKAEEREIIEYAK